MVLSKAKQRSEFLLGVKCLKMIAVITDFATAWYFFTLETAFKPGKQANIFLWFKEIRTS